MFNLLLMPQIVGKQRKCCFFVLRTATTYTKMRNAIEDAVAWTIVWPGGVQFLVSSISISDPPPRIFHVGFFER
jgi:hypothetical protein